MKYSVMNASYAPHNSRKTSGTLTDRKTSTKPRASVGKNNNESQSNKVLAVNQLPATKSHTFNIKADGVSKKIILTPHVINVKRNLTQPQGGATVQVSTASKKSDIKYRREASSTSCNSLGPTPKTKKAMESEQDNTNKKTYSWNSHRLRNAKSVKAQDKSHRPINALHNRVSDKHGPVVSYSSLTDRGVPLRIQKRLLAGIFQLPAMRPGEFYDLQHDPIVRRCVLKAATTWRGVVKDRYSLESFLASTVH